MEVNFNNLRTQAIHSYDSLCKKLNEAILKEGCDTAFLDGFGLIREGVIVIDAEDIQKSMDSLRMLIGSIAMVYEPGDEKFKDVYSEVFPENEDTRMQSFNDTED